MTGRSYALIFQRYIDIMRRAHLYLVLKVYDDTGAVESQERFECQKTDTMDRAGVTEGAELMILLDGA